MNKKNNLIDSLKDKIKKKINSFVETQDYKSLETPLKKSGQIKDEFKRSLDSFLNPDHIVEQVTESVDLIYKNIKLVCDPTESAKVRKELDDCNQRFAEYLNETLQGDKGEEKATYQQIFGFSDDSLLHIYHLANHFYNEDIAKAKNILNLLIYLAPNISNFWVALGLCFLKEQRYEEGLAFFEMAEIINEDNPAAYVYRIVCLLETNHKKEALIELKKLEGLLNKNAELKKDWQEQIENLKRRI